MTDEFKVFCPKCGYPQYCSCKSCTEAGRTPDGIKPWIFLEHDAIACANCGYALHMDGWLNVESEQYRNYQDRQRLLAYEPEEWQLWMEGMMLGLPCTMVESQLACLFCRSYASHLRIAHCQICIPGSRKSHACVGQHPHYEKPFPRSDRLFAGWDRLKRTGIL